MTDGPSRGGGVLRNPFVWFFFAGIILITLMRPLLRREPAPPPVVGQLPAYSLVDTTGRSFGSAELAGFGEAELTRIMGQSLPLHPRDFLHSILEARNIMNRSLELIGEERGMFSLWDLRGVEGCVDLCIQNSRKEKGFLFELDLASWLRTNIVDPPKGGPFANLNVFDMILEIKIDGHSGQGIIAKPR